MKKIFCFSWEFTDGGREITQKVNIQTRLATKYISHVFLFLPDLCSFMNFSFHKRCKAQGPPVAREATLTTFRLGVVVVEPLPKTYIRPFQDGSSIQTNEIHES